MVSSIPIISKKEKLATKPLISVSGLPSLNGSLGDFIDEIEDEISNYFSLDDGTLHASISFIDRFLIINIY